MSIHQAMQLNLRTAQAPKPYPQHESLHTITTSDIWNFSAFSYAWHDVCVQHLCLHGRASSASIQCSASSP